MSSPLASRWRTARDSLRYEGPAIFVWRVLTRLLAPVVDLDIQVLFEIDLTQPIEARSPRIDCVVEQVGEAELDRIIACHFSSFEVSDESTLSDAEEYAYLRREREYMRTRQRAREEMLNALRAGELCFVARVGEEIAHSNWIQFHWSRPVAGRPIALMPGEIYGVEGYTNPRWRGLALHEAVLSRMLRHAQTLGCRHGYTIADLANPKAYRGVLRVGWRRRGHHLFVKVRGVRRTWIVRLGGDIEPILRKLRGSASPEDAAAARAR